MHLETSCAASSTLWASLSLWAEWGFQWVEKMGEQTVNLQRLGLVPGYHAVTGSC